MLIKPAFLLIISVSFKSSRGKYMRLPLPLPVFVVLSLTLSAEEIIDLIWLFSRKKKQLAAAKGAVAALKYICWHIMFTVGRHEYVRVEANDKSDRVKVRIHTI
ncbi:MAG: hypothetical protein ACOX3X_05080 [Eubacteriales bacterium]|jgi:hypothetical protein